MELFPMHITSMKDEDCILKVDGWNDTHVVLLTSDEEEYGNMACISLTLEQAEQLAKAITRHVEKVRAGTWDEVK